MYMQHIRNLYGIQTQTLYPLFINSHKKSVSFLNTFLIKSIGTLKNVH